MKLIQLVEYFFTLFTSVHFPFNVINDFILPYVNLVFIFCGSCFNFTLFDITVYFLFFCYNCFLMIKEGMSTKSAQLIKTFSTFFTLKFVLTFIIAFNLKVRLVFCFRFVSIINNDLPFNIITFFKMSFQFEFCKKQATTFLTF